MSIHLAARPSWRCRTCDDEWPCGTRRTQLLAEYGTTSVSLVLFLSACLLDAIGDLPNWPAGMLYWRFLGWLRDAGR